ncbi:MAG: ParB/RepB/Spo0J family partition protein [Flavobacteriaceae bacterium]
MAKANKRQALGRGLSALLDDSEKSAASKEEIIGNVVELPLDKIEVNPFQPRTNFNEESIEDLAKSIQALGVIQPITVRKIENDNFQLVSGERRLRAAKSIGLQTIPSFIRIADDQESLEMALVENIQREDLDPIEIALSYQRLIDEIELTQEELSERVGKKRSTITNYIRLLRLDPIIQTGMRDGFISMGHGRALISVEDRSKQLSIYEQILAKGLSVRATEKLVKTDASTPTKKTPASNPYVEGKIDFYKNIFGEKVRIQLNSSGGGQIVVPFSSKKEFKALTKRLQSDS